MQNNEMFFYIKLNLIFCNGNNNGFYIWEWPIKEISKKKGVANPISIDLILNEIERDIDRAKFESATQEILELKETQLPPNVILRLDLYLSRILRETGKLNESISFNKLILESAISLNDENLIIQTYLEKAACHWTRGELEKGIELINTAQSLMSGIDTDYRKFHARSQLILGNLIGDQGDLDRCLELYNDAMNIYRTINDNDGVAMILNNLGTLYRLLGNLDEALICYEKSGEIFKKLDNPILNAMSLGNIGDIYLDKGELDIALDYLLRAHKILEDINDKVSLAEVKASIGIFYYAKGQYKNSILYFKDSLALFDIVDNDVWISATLLYYILAYSEIDNNKAKQLLDRFNKIIEKLDTKSKLIEIRYKLAKSTVLKKTNRLENLAMAQKLLYQIIDNDEIVDYALTLMAMKHLADLLILELKLSDDSQILAELIQLISKLNDSALIHGSSKTQVQTYILFAKLKLLNGEFQIAIDSLDTAEKISKENGLQKLMKEVNSEKEQILQKASLYEKAYGDLTNIEEKLAHANIEAYLNEILTNGILQNKHGSSSS